MKRQWTVGQQLFTGIAALFVLLMCAAGIAYRVASTMNDALDRSTQVTARKLELALQIEREVTKLQGDQRRILLAGFGNDKSMFESTTVEITKSITVLTGQLESIKGLLQTEAGRKAVADTAEAVARWKDVNQDVERLVNGGKITEAWSLAREKANPLVDRAAQDANGLVEQQRDFLKTAEAESAAEYRSTLWLIGALAILSLLVSGGVVWAVNSITHRLRADMARLGDGSRQVTAAATQVSTSAQSLSQGATEQAASLEETSASMEEMASMTRKNADNSQQASALMAEVHGRVSESNALLHAMVAATDAIKDSSTKVARIIKTIDEIAFQTNILALNAAVEAARAGDAGMGFAVVADEVRNLAQRSAQAAKDTATLIEQSIASAQEGATKVEQVTAAVGGITDSVGRVKNLVDEVSVASRQQSQGIDQVSQAVAQMEKVTQGTAATAEESAAASEELNAQADAALGLVAHLTALVGGESGDARPAPTARAAAKSRANAGGTKVVAIPARAVSARRTAEEAIPLGDGTFGRF